MGLKASLLKAVVVSVDPGRSGAVFLKRTLAPHDKPFSWACRRHSLWLSTVYAWITPCKIKVIPEGFFGRGFIPPPSFDINGPSPGFPSRVILSGKGLDWLA